MKDLNIVSDILRNAVKRCVSVDATISGPHTASNDKQFYKAKFKVVTTDEDGYIGQSKLYTKVFFEDSHSLLFLAAQEALENGTPLKIKAGRLQIATKKPFYILDENGDRMKKKNGEFRMGRSITLFLIEDENWETQFQAQCDQLTAKGAWVEDPTADEEIDAEEEKATNTKENAEKGKGNKGGKK